MRIALFASLLGVEATGQSQVVAETATRLAQAGHEVTVIATDCGFRGEKVKDFVSIPAPVRVLIFPADGWLNRRLYRSPSLLAWARQHAREFDVLDVHGIWSYSGMRAANIFQRQGVPYILTPHGTMSRYDWQKGTLRRKIFFALGFGSVWRHANAIRFLSKGERDTSYHPAVGLAAIIPNGIELRGPVGLQSRRESRQRLSYAMVDALLLLLGRVTHQKGVHEIVEAFEIAASQRPLLRLALVGPAEGEYGEKIREQVLASRYSDRVRLVGPVFGDGKFEYFEAADVFITLSFNEGMSKAHLEAMAFGLPMILTEASNMDYLEEYDAGVLTTHDPKDSSEAMLRMLSDPARLQEAGHNARRLVEEKYEADRVTQQLVDLYAELAAVRK